MTIRARSVAAAAVTLAVFALTASLVDAADDDIGDVTSFAVTDQGDAIISTGREDGSRGALIFVHNGKARIVHRFEPYNTSYDVVATPDGFVGWTGYPESGGGAYAVVHGRFRRTFALVDHGSGTILTTPGVPYGGGLLVGGDGGTSDRCRRTKVHPGCAALYRFDVHGVTVVATFSSNYPRILASDGARVWFRTSGLSILDAQGIRFVANVLPWAVEPLDGGSALVAYPDAGQTLRFATVAPNGVTRTILRVPFSTFEASGEGFVEFIRLGAPGNDAFYGRVGEQERRSEARSYALLPGRSRKVARIVACDGAWVPVHNGPGAICTDARGLMYVLPDGTAQKLAPASAIAPVRATAIADHSIWVVVANDPPMRVFNPTAPFRALRRNPAFLVHFSPGGAPTIVQLPQ